MEHHHHPGYNLESELDQVDDPQERARIIAEAYETMQALHDSEALFAIDSLESHIIRGYN